MSVRVQPNRLIILLGYVGAMISLIMLMSPKEIKVTDDFSIKVFAWDDFLPNKSDNPTVDLSAIKALESSIDSLEKNEEAAKEEADQPEEEEEFIPEELDKHIQFPENNPHVLDNFFNALQTLESNPQLIRIVHYGDSQLEGDRISEYLRNRFQSRFGGCGVGMVATTEIKNIRSTLHHENSENFARYEVFGAARKPSLHKDYGHLGSYHKFAYQLPDSLKDKEAKWVTGKLRYAKSYIKTYKRVNQVENIKLVYRNRFSPLVIDGVLNKGKSIYDSLGIHQGISVWQTPVNQNFSEFDFELRSKGDPEIYGLSFDCQTGIAFDNSPFRGSSGIEFTKMNKAALRQQIQKLNVKFMILQFGVNVIPYVRMEYGYYKRSFKRQLQFLKSLSPDLNIIVIGPSDMARKKGEKFASYPNVPILRDAMKEAAFESDCAFWDLYGAMGGKGSITAWVASKPALANPDYTHFTRRGAKLVGELFFNALMKAYTKHTNTGTKQD